MGLGKIPEGGKMGVPFKLCLLIHGLGFVPPISPRALLMKHLKCGFFPS